MAVYRLNDRVWDDGDQGFIDLLPQAYSSKTRPLCQCRAPGVEMYIAKVQDRYLVKRMPNTGGDHDPSCDSYEPPAELSGLGQVKGSAIQENPDEGTTALKLNFSLSKGASRIAPSPGGGESDSVKTEGNKLGLRGLLHFLWEEAGFNRWTPAMEGKRKWYVIRKHLLQAAEDKVVKGGSLADKLYIPEVFDSDKKEEISQRRLAHLAQVAAPQKGPRRLMLAIGEVKDIAQARFGHKIVLKHVPDAHFMLNDDLHRRLLKRFELEIGLWNALPESHLVMIGTFGLGSTGIASLEEVALMVVTEHWVPFENMFEKTIIDILTQEGRRYLKGLRYNLPTSQALAFAVVSDTTPQPTAMYILPLGATEQYAEELEGLMTESKLPSWLWRAGEEEVPPLPTLTNS